MSHKKKRALSDSILGDSGLMELSDEGEGEVTGPIGVKHPRILLGSCTNSDGFPRRLVIEFPEESGDPFEVCRLAAEQTDGETEGWCSL